MSPDTPIQLIARAYQFALSFGAVLAFGAIVYGALKYAIARGNPAGQSDAKDRITQALLGLLLLLGAYLILRTVNPELVALRLPSLTQLTPPTITGLREPGAGGFCQTVRAGEATVERLRGACSWDPDQASRIAMKESSGRPFEESGVDRCRPGNEAVSYGLFQINISAERVGGLDCPSAFSAMYTGSNHNCRITNQGLYNACQRAATDAATNIQTACELFKRRGWQPWLNSAKACGIQ